MDSSRSGLLSTLIMTVPLVVVPAIALLRPAIPAPGISTNTLEASSADDPFSEFEFDELPPDSPDNDGKQVEKDESSDDADDYLGLSDREDQAGSNGLFESKELKPDSQTALVPSPPFEPDPFAPGSAAPGATLPGSTPSNPASPDASPAMPGAGPSSPAPQKPAPDSRLPLSPDDESALLKQIMALGATRTIWFTPGKPSQFGFAAFVSVNSKQISYRFEAIGNSRAEAIRLVLAQITEWQNAQRAASP